MKAAAGPFVLKLDSVSKCECQMLDVNIDFRFSVSGEKGYCCFSLLTKPSSIWQPLSPDSNHPKSIHVHWPRAQCARIRGLFSCAVAGDRAVKAFKLRYFNSFGVHICQPESKPDLPTRPTSWIVLPYNACLLLGS